MLSVSMRVAMTRSYHLSGTASEVVVVRVRAIARGAQSLRAAGGIGEARIALDHHLEVVERLGVVADRFVGDADLVVQALALALGRLDVERLLELMDRLGRIAHLAQAHAD